MKIENEQLIIDFTEFDMYSKFRTDRFCIETSDGIFYCIKLTLFNGSIITLRFFNKDEYTTVLEEVENYRDKILGRLK